MMFGYLVNCWRTTLVSTRKLLWNCISLKKDEAQVSFIEMRINGIWKSPDADQEVGGRNVLLETEKPNWNNKDILTGIMKHPRLPNRAPMKQWSLTGVVHLEWHQGEPIYL